jgi:hypothetical protein
MVKGKAVLYLIMQHTMKVYEFWYSSVTEYQVGKNSDCEFFRLVPFLQLAIHMGRAEIKLHAFLFSALDGGQWSASHSSHFTNN